MAQSGRILTAVVIAAGIMAAPKSGLTHGDVQPHAISTEGLKPLGDTWLSENPYRGNPLAIKIGESGYSQNCARCHGLGAVSGGFSPDLRHLPRGADGDDIFIPKVRKGVARNGSVYMPSFDGILTQEAMWAIRSWLDTKFTDQ
jgi:cytochrome c-550 PedF